jgi:hypothetical protein
MKCFLFAVLTALVLCGCSGEEGPDTAGSSVQEKPGSGTKKAGGDKESAEAARARAAASHIRALGSEKLSTRDKAADALIEMGEAAVEPLIEALGHRNGHIRANAAWVLGQLKDERSIEPLIKALKDGSSDVRAYAALALGKIGDDKAVPALKEAVNDTDKDVSKTAQQSLDKMVPQEEPKPAKQYVDDAGKTPTEVVRAYMKACNDGDAGAIFDFMEKEFENQMSLQLVLFRRGSEERKAQICTELGISREKFESVSVRDWWILVFEKARGRLQEYKAFELLGEMELKSCTVEGDKASAETVHPEHGFSVPIDLKKEEGIWKVEMRKK